MFIDHVKIHIEAGNGGNGSASFRTEKYIPNGGPDGGDGGKGGDVILVADGNMSTLQDFRYKRIYKAQHGADGGKKKMFGKSGDDLEIRVPVGSLVRDAQDGELLADFTADGQRYIAAKGGKGGLGNVHFANSVRQAPNFARAGREGEQFDLEIELKLLADVGLLGMPNVGKSTFLSVISKAKPKIANYAFTTLEPVLGIVERLPDRFVVADIPGLIEGAAAGQGLGIDFLRHVERCRILIHLVDMAAEHGYEPLQALDTINRELEAYSPELAGREQIVVGSRIDLAEPETLAAFKAEIIKRGLPLFYICAPTHQGVPELLDYCFERLSQIPVAEPVFRQRSERRAYIFKTPQETRVERTADGFLVSGDWIEQLVNSVNFSDIESIQYFQRQLERHGVNQALADAGAQEGDLVCLDEYQFEYIP